MSEDEMPTDKRTKSTPRFIKAETEKMVVHDTASYFTERKERADFDAFKRILTREGGVAPREGDGLKGKVRYAKGDCTTIFARRSL